MNKSETSMPRDRVQMVVDNQIKPVSQEGRTKGAVGKSKQGPALDFVH